jgi:hypothetical protein
MSDNLLILTLSESDYLEMLLLFYFPAGSFGIGHEFFTVL